MKLYRPKAVTQVLFGGLEVGEVFELRPTNHSLFLRISDVKMSSGEVGNSIDLRTGFVRHTDGRIKITHFPNAYVIRKEISRGGTKETR